MKSGWLLVDGKMHFFTEKRGYRMKYLESRCHSVPSQDIASAVIEEFSGIPQVCDSCKKKVTPAQSSVLLRRPTPQAETIFVVSDFTPESASAPLYDNSDITPLADIPESTSAGIDGGGGDFSGGGASRDF